MASNEVPGDGKQGPERVGVYPSGPTAGGAGSAGPGDMRTTRTVETGSTDGAYHATSSSSPAMRWAIPLAVAIVVVLALIWLL